MPFDKKVDKEELRQYMLDNPHLTYAKIAFHFDVGVQTIKRYAKSFGMTKEREADEALKEVSGAQDAVVRTIRSGTVIKSGAVTRHHMRG